MTELPGKAQLPSTSLQGVRVAVTRAKAQASTLVEALEGVGAEAVEVATIDVSEPSDGGIGLVEAVQELDRYDWVVLTSTNAVDRYLAVIDPNLIAAEGHRLRYAVVGSATLAALEAASISAGLVPNRFVASALVDDFPVGNGRVLFPSAAVTSPTIVEGLTAKGWRVDQVEAYRTVAADVTDAQRHAVERCDAALFTSGSSVDRFVELVGLDRLPATVICIGPTTAATAVGHGIEVSAVADPHTIDGLVAALAAVWTTR